MYSSDEFESDLINSYAYDTALVFIQKFSGDTNYSRQLGSNSNGQLCKTGQNILYYINPGEEATDIRCNIYDFAGNEYEWTTETHLPNAPCTYRGGFYNSFSYCPGERNCNAATNLNNSDISFRVILYVNQ